MENWMSSILWLVIVGAVICYYVVKNSNNRKAAQSGEDKERLRRAVEPLLGGDGNHRILYSHWEEQEYYGRTTRITYYRYAIAYQDQTLYVAPLHIDKKTREIQAGQPTAFTPENLGKVTVNTTQKNGMVKHMDIWLFDKQGQTLSHLYVDAENLQKTRYYPVNIAQWDECAAFDSFMNSFIQRVAAANPDIEDVIKANNKAGAATTFGVFGAILSIIGAIAGVFFAPVGIILALIGLILSIVGKVKGAKGVVALVISIVCFMTCISSLVALLATL